MAHDAEVLQTDIIRLQLNAASNAKDHIALRSQMRALEADINGSHPPRLSVEDKARLRAKLQLTATATAPFSSNDSHPSDDSRDGRESRDDGSGHISVFA